MRFFFDTSISLRLVRALKVIAEHQAYEILHLNERYDKSSVPDEEWLTDLGKDSDWIIISADPRITRGKVEKAAWMESGLTAFFFSDGWSSRTIYEQGADLIRRWPDIVRLSKENPKEEGFLIGTKEIKKIT